MNHVYYNSRMNLAKELSRPVVIRHIADGQTIEGKAVYFPEHGWLIEQKNGDLSQPFGQGWMMWCQGQWYEVKI